MKEYRKKKANSNQYKLTPKYYKELKSKNEQNNNLVIITKNKKYQKKQFNHKTKIKTKILIKMK
jgi:hypothetical protein